MTNRIILFKRVPKVGTTKTRIYDFVSPDTAVEIQKKLMKKNYNVLKECGEEIAVYNDGQRMDDTVMENILENRELSYQVSETLSDKMYNAIDEELQSSDKVILLSSDI